jgi:hypothetical protein
LASAEERVEPRCRLEHGKGSYQRDVQGACDDWPPAESRAAAHWARWRHAVNGAWRRESVDRDKASRN